MTRTVGNHWVKLKCQCVWAPSLQVPFYSPFLFMSEIKFGNLIQEEKFYFIINEIEMGRNWDFLNEI